MRLLFRPTLTAARSQGFRRGDGFFNLSLKDLEIQRRMWWALVLMHFQGSLWFVLIRVTN